MVKGILMGDPKLDDELKSDFDFSKTLYFNDDTLKIIKLTTIFAIFFTGCGYFLISHGVRHFDKFEKFIGWVCIFIVIPCIFLLIYNHCRYGFPSLIVNVDGVIFTRFSKEIIPWSIVTGIEVIQVTRRSTIQIIFDFEGGRFIDIAYPSNYDREFKMNSILSLMQPLNRRLSKGMSIPADSLSVPHNRLLYIIRSYYFEARRIAEERTKVAIQAASPET
jgi:hypothetical protein